MSITELIWKTIVSIFKIISEVLIELLTALGYLVIGAFDLILNKIPAWVTLPILGGLVTALVISEDLRNLSNEFIVKAKEYAKDIIIKLKEFIKWVIETAKEFWEIFKPIGITGAEIAGYFTMEYKLMLLQVEKLDNERSK